MGIREPGIQDNPPRITIGDTGRTQIKKKAYTNVSLDVMILMVLIYFCSRKLYILDFLTRSDLWFLPFTIKHADC